MRFKFILAAMMFASTSAFAADLAPQAVEPIAPPSAYDWTGFYVGLNAGGGWGSQDGAYKGNDPSSRLLFQAGGQPPSGTLHMSGVLGGAQLGYNWQFASKWVAGVETDLDFSGMKDSMSGHAQIADPSRPVTAIVREKMRGFGTLRVRFGYLPLDNLLVYATGGLAYANVDTTGRYAMTAGGPIGALQPPVTFVCFPRVTCFSGSDSSWVAGWTLGAGLEYALTSRLTVKAEYLHSQLASKSIVERAARPFPNAACCSTISAKMGDNNVDMVRLGVNWHL